MVVLSLSSIPTRFKYLPAIVQQLLKLHPTCPLYVCIPDTYKRFPGEFSIPTFSDPRVKVLRGPDYGPATKFLLTALEVSEDEKIIYVDDDTSYPQTLVERLLHDDDGVYGLSGFKLDQYFSGTIIRGHMEEVDVIEGYGGVCVPAKILKNNFNLILNFLKLTLYVDDDMSVSNLYKFLKVPVRTVYLADCHVGLVRQYQYGFEADAIHRNNGEGSHLQNNKRILKTFTDKNCNHFNYNAD